jgi:hypothetical protein
MATSRIAGLVVKTDEPVQPRTVAGTAVEMAAKKHERGDELTEEELAALGDTAPTRPKVQSEESEDEQKADADEEPELESTNEVPAWAVLPPDLKIPKGKQVYFIRIPADLTDRPNDGDHHCVAWNLNIADEDTALKRSRGEQFRVMRESCMQMIRAIDGHRVDWTNSNLNAPGNVKRWFNDIGPRGRLLVQNVYIRTHSVNNETSIRFFVDCFASMSSV